MPKAGDAERMRKLCEMCAEMLRVAGNDSMIAGQIAELCHELEIKKCLAPWVADGAST